MLKNDTRKKVLLNVPKEVNDSFQSNYPRLMTIFLRRCLLKANSDRKFFEDVFFGTVDKYSLVGQNRPEYFTE